MRKGVLPVVYLDIVVLAPCAEIDGLEDSGVLAVTDLSGIPVSWAEASQLLNVTDTSPTAVLYRYLFARAANEQRSATVVTLSTTFDPVATGAEEFVVAIRALMASFAKESGYGTIKRRWGVGCGSECRGKGESSLNPTIELRVRHVSLARSVHDRRRTSHD